MPRFRPLSLPTVPLGQQLTANLIPDPVTPDARALVATATSYPSLLRRARVVRDGAHFSFVTPLPLAFPYEFPPPSNDSVSDAESVERYLRDFEPQRTNPGAALAALSVGTSSGILATSARNMFATLGCGRHACMAPADVWCAKGLQLRTEH